jgi:hypothetical protein
MKATMFQAAVFSILVGFLLMLSQLSGSVAASEPHEIRWREATQAEQLQWEMNRDACIRQLPSCR